MTALALAGSCNAPKNSSQAIQAQPQLDERLTKITMTDLDGKRISLADFAGKPIFLNFWATWCGPCVSEMKSIEAVSQQFKKDIVFLAASTESPEKIRSFRQKNPFHFQFVQLNVSYLDLYVLKLPTTFLINKKGELVAEAEGYRDWSDPANREKLRRLVEH